MTEETNPKDESTKVSQDVIAWFYLVDIVGRFFDLLMICEMCGPYMSIENTRRSLGFLFLFLFWVLVIVYACHHFLVSFRIKYIYIYMYLRI